jgi:hypothetical protein
MNQFSKLSAEDETSRLAQITSEEMFEVERIPLRFVLDADYGELINLYHLARTALSGGSDSRHARMLWACKHFAAKHSYVTIIAAYKDLSARIAE